MKLIYIAQIFGAIALLTNAISILKNKKKSILLYNGASNIACIIQYLLLGQLPGAISSAIATLRNVVFSKFKNKIPLIILIIYIAIALGFNLPYCKNIMDIIPIFNIIVYGFGIWQTNIETLKIINIITGFTGMIYDINASAYTGFINQFVSFVAGIISYVEYRKNKKICLRGKKLQMPKKRKLKRTKKSK